MAYEEAVSDEDVQTKERIACRFEPRREMRKALNQLHAIRALIMVHRAGVEEPLQRRVHGGADVHADHERHVMFLDSATEVTAVR